MNTYVATIKVLLVANSDAEACDAMAESMRPMLQTFCDNQSNIVDWRYAKDGIGPDRITKANIKGLGFEYVPVAPVTPD